MGEPAIPTTAERAERHNLATAIVRSVVEDEKMPLPDLKVLVYTSTASDAAARGIAFDCLAVEEFVFPLAQEITLLLEERIDPPTPDEVAALVDVRDRLVKINTLNTARDPNAFAVKKYLDRLLQPFLRRSP